MKLLLKFHLVNNIGKIVSKPAVVFIFLISNCISAQNTNELNPYRIGVKIGTPYAVSLDFEYVMPILESRIAPFVDFTTIGIKAGGNARLNYTAFEVGTNIYFRKRGDGRGFYGALSYQKVNTRLKQRDYEANDGRLFEGTATTAIVYNGFNTKIGVKVGRTFYFRTELGYSFGKIPTEVVTKGTYNGAPATDNQDISQDIKDIPLISTGGMPVFNLGFGFAF